MYCIRAEHIAYLRSLMYIWSLPCYLQVLSVPASVPASRKNLLVLWIAKYVAWVGPVYVADEVIKPSDHLWVSASPCLPAHRTCCALTGTDSATVILSALNAKLQVLKWCKSPQSALIPDLPPNAWWAAFLSRAHCNLGVSPPAVIPIRSNLTDTPDTETDDGPPWYLCIIFDHLHSKRNLFLV